jgi:hypothetical protein
LTGWHNFFCFDSITLQILAARIEINGIFVQTFIRSYRNISPPGRFSRRLSTWVFPIIG